MNDIDGNEVVVGDVVRVLSIDSHYLDSLDDDARMRHLAMMGNTYCIDEIVEDGRKASVSIQWDCAEGVAVGGLYMLANEFRLVK